MLGSVGFLGKGVILGATGEVTFVEMPSPIERQVECPDKAVASSGPAALIRTGKLEIELSNDISDELLSKILKVTAYAR